MKLARIALAALLAILISGSTPSSALVSSPPRMASSEVDLRMLDDTINHWEVTARLEAIERWERAVAENERKAQAAKAAAEAARSERRSAERPTVSGDLLDKLANCESSMNRYAVATVRGVSYYSYFQWLPSTWRNVSGLSGMPQDYDYATQKAAAAKIPLSAWPKQFPGCSRKLGVG